MSTNETQTNNVVDANSFDTSLAAYIIYDVNTKLPQNLNYIHDIKNYQIYKFGIDSLNNQWFLYKPRDADNVTTNPGQLWVRLTNFPYAYPVLVNSTSVSEIWTQNTNLTTGTNNIINFDINNNIGIIQTEKQIICFCPIEYINEDHTVRPVTALSNVIYLTQFNKLINIEINCVYNFNESQKILGYIFSNNMYTVFFSEPGNNKQINYKRISSEPEVQYNYEITSDGSILLPNAINTYSNMDGVFNIFTNNTDINIVMECPSNA